MVFAILASVIVWFAPFAISHAGEVPIYLYVILVVNYAFYQICLYCMFVAVMAFFAKISDPAVGGTYMTLLNTVCNLGGNWPTTIVLWLVDVLTWKQCSPGLSNGDKPFDAALLNNTCVNKIEEEVRIVMRVTFRVNHTCRLK